jgi:hypothetical protein
VEAEKTNSLLGTGYKWIGFENGLWMPVKRINLNGVRKAGVDGWDINWHTLTPNYNETSFNRVVGSIDDAVLQQKVINRRKSTSCKIIDNSLNQILAIFGLGTLTVSADTNGCLTNAEAKLKAALLGYVPASPNDIPKKLNSHGSKVFKNGKNFISPDNTGHGYNESTVWKVFDSEGNRIGSADEDLNIVRK